MIEVTLKEYLESKLVSPAVPIYFEIPAGLTEKDFIILEKTGGGGDSKVYSATVAVQSYAASLYAAADLNERVKSIMETFAEETASVSLCELNSDYNFTDPDSKRYRYQAVYNIIHY